MRCVFADTDAAFLAGLKRCFKYTPVVQDQYPLMVHGQAVTAWNAVHCKSSAWLVTPGENENRLRLEGAGVDGTDGSGRRRLYCPAAAECNARQLVRAVLKFVATHNSHVDFVVIPRLGDATLMVAQNMHAGYVDGVTKKSGGTE